MFFSFFSRGYASYELAMNGIFTAKSDMYSLGIIIMDLLVGYKKREEFVADLTPGGDIVDTVMTLSVCVCV